MRVMDCLAAEEGAQSHRVNTTLRLLLPAQSPDRREVAVILDFKKFIQLLLDFNHESKIKIY